jgi:type II secretion system protein H
MVTKMPRREAMAGFSGIELLVVIGLGGILLAIAWIRMSTLIPIYRLEGAARDLVAELQKARGRAIAEGRCTRVTINVGAKTYQFERAPTSTCTGFVAVPGEGVRRIDDANSLTVASGSDPVFAVFDARGTVPTPAVITLMNAENGVRTVFVQSTGFVSVQ